MNMMPYDTTKVADALRKLALDEGLKNYVLADPKLRSIAKRVAQKYVAGEKMIEAIERAVLVNNEGYRATIDFMGESTRSQSETEAVVREFLHLIKTIKIKKLQCSISLDLSHIGSVVSYELCLKNARLLAIATKETGVEMMISMEGAERINDILSIHKIVSEEFNHVGVTIQARLHRTRQDLPELLKRSGRIRLVKGAYDTSAKLAYPRDSKELRKAYDNYVEQLLRSGHLCSIATHDWDRLKEAEKMIAQYKTPKQNYIFEFLSGLGVEQAKAMHARGYPVQEYIVYGQEWWLYVCNRIAEEPSRLFEALITAVGHDI